MELTLAQPIESRLGAPFSDSHILNGIVQTYGKLRKVTKRPGLAAFYSFTAGTGQGGFTLSGKDYAIINNTINLCETPYTAYAIPSGPVSLEMFDVIANPPYITTALAVLKTTTGLWTFDGTTVTKLTPANYPATTVRGIVLLDGTYYVMDPTGKIWGSNIADITTWTALNVLTVNAPEGLAVGIALNDTYVTAFGSEWTSQYYDNNNPPPGSPLAWDQAASHAIGCASAASIQTISDFVIFMSLAEGGRGIRIMRGAEMKEISTPDVNRILDADNLATVYSMGFSVDGRAFYLLTLGTTGITLIYDFTEQFWTFWASGALGAYANVSMTLDADLTTVQVSWTGHGCQTSDVINIKGATNNAFNGDFTVTVVNANNLTVQLGNYNHAIIDQNGNFLVDEHGNNLVANALPAAGTVAGTTQAAKYSTSYFSAIASMGADLMVDEADGRVYQLKSAAYTDVDGLIDLQIVTKNFAGKNSDLVPVGAIEVRGDKVANSTGYISYTDDDYQTFSTPQPINMDNSRAQTVRCGKTRRRAIKFRHTDNVFCRVETLLVDVPE